MCTYWSLAYKFWLEAMMMPLKMSMMTAPVADSMQEAVAIASDPKAVAKLDPIHADDIPNILPGPRLA